MQITSVRRTEALKIQKKYIKWDEGIIELPGSITKSGKDRFLAITSKLKIVLDKISEIKKRPGYEWVNFVPWLFPTPRFRTEDFYDNKLGQEYIQSDLTRLKNIRCAWIKIMEVTGIKIGAPKMLRKAYSTTAKDILGATGPATQLTGHEEDSTLDRFYYGADKQTVKNNAEKVAGYFDFIKESN
jgi:integrase